MLLTLTMLPCPLAAISGSERRHEEERRADVTGEHLVELSRVERRCRGPACDPGVVDQDVDLADFACQALHLRWVGEIGGDEAGLAAGVGDLVDRLRATGGVAAVNEDLCPVPVGQL